MKGRYNITLTAELDKRLDLNSFQTGKSRSALIEEALNLYLSGPIEPLHNIHNDEISILKGRIDLIESKLRNIESSENTDCVTLNSIDKDVSDASKIPVFPTQRISNDQDQPHDTHEEEKIVGLDEEIANGTSPTDTEITNQLNPLTQKNSDIPAITGPDPERWYAQYEVVSMLDPKNPPNTRKGWVSKAVAGGKLETNGEKGKECRIKGSSAIKWLKELSS